MFNQKKQNGVEEADLELQEQLEREKEWAKKKEEFLKSLEEDSLCNSVVCVCTRRTELKQLALNYMVKKGWICVQNAIEDRTGYYELTFTKREFAESFK